MTDALFQYGSVAVDDLGATRRVYEQIGTVVVWEGRHPYFNADCVLCAARRGGILLMAVGAGAHAAVRHYEGRKERNFHFCLAVADLAARRALCEASEHVTGVSEIYDGPLGPAFAAELRIAGGTPFWVEFSGDTGRLVGDAGSTVLRVESTAMVAPDRDHFLLPFASMGLEANYAASDCDFPALNGINSAIVLDNHYLEVVAPTGEGPVGGFLGRIGRPGIFGLNLEPLDMGAFLAAAKADGVAVNTEEPILLKVEVRGVKYDCAHIVTINPRATGGARIFMLSPIDYPWALVAAG